jgi:hypothetical protein
LKSSILKNDLEKPIDSIIFKFIKEGTKESVYAKAVDPLVLQLNRSAEAEREPQDLFGIILSDIVEFIQINGLSKYKVSENTDEAFVNLVSDIFNDYIDNKGYRYEGVNIDPLEFAKAPQFELNTGIITNLKTRDLLAKSQINRQIFKIMMSSFNKPKKKPTGTLTQSLIDDLLEISKKIKEKTSTESKVEESGVPTFEEFYRKKIENSWVIKD